MDDLKPILRDLWANKPLLIALAVGLGIVIFIIVRNSQQNASTATAPVSTATGGTYVEGGTGVGETQPMIVGGGPVPITAMPVAPVVTGLPIARPIIGGGAIPIPTPVVGAQPSPTGHPPGTTFLGPTGVKHYVTTGTQTLSQIAQKFGLPSWNSIYAIPDNMKAFRAIWGKQAQPGNDLPPSGMTITLPGKTVIGF